MKIKLPQGWSLIEKTETGSTNEDAKKLPSGSDKTAVCARIQTGGHGRMGRRWVSPAGNLYVSFCLEPVRPEQAGVYSFLSAVALMQAIEKLCPGLRVNCKWPNDLLINGNIILLKGRLSLREDKEPSIVCDSLEPCPQDKKVGESKPNKKVRHGLFLRVPSQESELTARAENLLAIFDGNTPAYFYYNDSKKYSSKAVAVDVNDTLIKELKRILGSENVVFQ